MLQDKQSQTLAVRVTSLTGNLQQALFTSECFVLQQLIFSSVRVAGDRNGLLTGDTIDRQRVLIAIHILLSFSGRGGPIWLTMSFREYATPGTIKRTFIFTEIGVPHGRV